MGKLSVLSVIMNNSTLCTYKGSKRQVGESKKSCTIVCETDSGPGMEGGEWERERAQPPLLSPLVNVGTPLPIILRKMNCFPGSSLFFPPSLSLSFTYKSESTKPYSSFSLILFSFPFSLYPLSPLFIVCFSPSLFISHFYLPFYNLSYFTPFLHRPPLSFSLSAIQPGYEM